LRIKKKMDANSMDRLAVQNEKHINHSIPILHLNNSQVWLNIAQFLVKRDLGRLERTCKNLYYIINFTRPVNMWDVYISVAGKKIKHFSKQANSTSRQVAKEFAHAILDQATSWKSIVAAGEEGVGKTSLAFRFVKASFAPYYDPTMGM